MHHSQSRVVILSMMAVLMISRVIHGAPTDLGADDIPSEIRSLCRSLCETSATLCPPECYDALVSKRALRVSRGPNFRNIRLRVNSASTAPSSSFDDYLFMKFLGQNMIGANGAPGGHH